MLELEPGWLEGAETASFIDSRETYISPVIDYMFVATRMVVLE
jgi:hypothetical protein